MVPSSVLVKFESDPAKQAAARIACSIALGKYARSEAFVLNTVHGRAIRKHSRDGQAEWRSLRVIALGDDGWIEKHGAIDQDAAEWLSDKKPECLNETIFHSEKGNGYRGVSGETHHKHRHADATLSGRHAVRWLL